MTDTSNRVLVKQSGDRAQEGDEKVLRSVYYQPKSSDDANAKNWFVKIKLKDEVCVSLNGPCVEKRYYYDGEAFKGLGWGEILKGNKTRVAVRSSLGGKEVDVSRISFDKYGNMTAMMDPNGGKREVQWDHEYKRFAEKETAFVGTYSFSMTTTWDYKIQSCECFKRLEWKCDPLYL